MKKWPPSYKATMEWKSDPPSYKATMQWNSDPPLIKPPCNEKVTVYEGWSFLTAILVVFNYLSASEIWQFT